MDAARRLRSRFHSSELARQIQPAILGFLRAAVRLDLAASLHRVLTDDGKEFKAAFVATASDETIDDAEASEDFRYSAKETDGLRMLGST